MSRKAAAKVDTSKLSEATAEVEATRGDTELTCKTCGGPVHVANSGEGTNWYECEQCGPGDPVELKIVDEVNDDTG